ncbi:MAG: hypothetical protein K8T89_04515, partial [Planctomycetes bacterium]|nr:hypothetical protein [Planctomycetota bacterium]
AAVPSPVAVKADLTIKAQLKATGLENSRVKIRLSVSKRNSSTQTWDDIPDLERTEDFFLRKATGNEIEIVTKAPEKPGQIRVTLEIKEGPAEDRIPGNNKIQTFVPVTKEGVRILVIDRLRQELKFLRYAIATDKRFDFVELIRQTDDPPAAGESRKFDVFNEAYDVIILGDVSPARLSSIDPKLAENIAKLVTEKGVGLMMLGGLDSFGGTPGATQGDGWKNSPIAGLLPVLIADKTAQVDADVEIRPLPDAFNSYIMKLDPDSDKNKKIWEQLGESAATRLGGYTVLGTPKQGAKVYAMGRGRVKAVDELPLLVGQTIGNNARVLAFGGDQTWKWVNLGSEEGAADPELGTKLHARFWKQIVLWLAHQDEVAGSVYVNATPTRLAVNGKTIFDMGIKDKHGDDVPNPKMKYQVLKANETADEKLAKPAERGEKGKARGEFSPKEPGEYRVVAWGDAKDIDGSEVREAEAWFDVYPEVSGELLDPSAKDGFLLGLEYHSRGTSADVVRKADKLPAFLQEEFLDKPLKQTNVAPKKYPDWRRDGNNWFLPLVLVSFVVIIGLEWGLRRVWGMV